MRRYIIFFICTIASICSISAANYVCTDMFNLKNGLPNNGVTSLLQDSKGYIWIGTYDGLTRYNGHSFVTFTNTINSKIFQSNRVRSLFEGNNLDIWIGTDFGVTRYNYRTGQFIKLESGVDGVQNQECIIREIMHSQDGSQIYCLTERSGVLVYAENGELLKNFTIDREAIFQDAQHIVQEKYLLASNDGVILYDFETAEVTNIYNSNGAANFVGTLTRLDANTILYGSNNGILKITYDVANYQFKVDENYTYTESGVKTLHIDAQGDMWVGGISQGLFYLEDAANNWGKKLQRLSEPMRPAAFLSPYLGAMLVATFDNGLLKYNQDHQHFKSLDLSNIDIKPIRTVQILSYDDNHILYQNSYQHLSFYDLRDGKERALPFNLSASQMKDLRYITKLTNGDVWLFMSNDKQSWRLIKSKDSESLIRVDDQIMNDFEYEFPYTIREDYYGYMWIGTQEGLYRLTLGEDRQIDKITSIGEHSISRSKKIEKINTIYPDTISQSIWIGTSSQGLYNIKYDSTEQIKSASITNYKVDPSGENRIPSNFVSCVTRCKDTLWVATEQGGLCRVEEDNVDLRFIPYGTSDGVSSNSIKSILMDENGDIWVSTAFGLSKYNISKDDFLTYRAQQGVPFDEFTYNAIYAGDKLVFASENNLCYFNPTQLPQTSPIPNIEFTNLKLSGRVVEPTKKFNGRVILEHSLVDNDIIRLKYKENMITIGVDAICQDNSYGNHIKYRLLPLSSSWITAADNSQEIVLSGLRHGNYTLEVKTSDFFGQRSNLKCLNGYFRQCFSYLYTKSL